MAYEQRVTWERNFDSILASIQRNMSRLESNVKIVSNAKRVSSFNGRIGVVVPLTGDYDIFQITGLQAALDAKTETSTLHPISFSGSYTDLIDLPITTPTDWNDVTNKPTEFNPTEHNHDTLYYTKSQSNSLLDNKVNIVTGKGLSTNDYTTQEKSDLAAIKAVVGEGVSDGGSIVTTLSELLTVFETYGEGVDIAALIASKSPIIHSHIWNDITDRPTALSAFTNDEGFITAADVDFTGYATETYVGSQGFITNAALAPYALTSAVPTNNNQLTNGAGYITGFTETDPIWLADKPNYLTTANAAFTYQPIGNYALDNATVHLSGTETITGAKTFTSLVRSDSNINFMGGGFRGNQFNSNGSIGYFQDANTGDLVTSVFSNIDLRTYNGSAYATVLRVTGSGAAGNVLIGTTTDAGYKLDVNGTARVTSQLNISSTSSNSASLKIENGSNTYALRIGSTANIGAGAMQVNGSGSTSNNTAIFSNSLNDLNIWILDNGKVSFGKQVIMGAMGSINPDASAVLEIRNTTQGFLPPRMTEAQRTAIASPATGLMVYQTDATEGLYVKASGGWVQL